MGQRFLSSSDVDDMGGMAWRLQGHRLLPEHGPYRFLVNSVVDGRRLEKFVWRIKEAIDEGSATLERLSAPGETPGRYRIVTPEMDVEITEVD